jgi:hypothetical protein
VFLVKNRLQNWFFSQNNINPDFSATIMAGIWAKQAMGSFASACNASSVSFSKKKVDAQIKKKVQSRGSW